MATGFVQRFQGRVAVAFGNIWQNGAKSGAPFLFPGPPVSGSGGTLAGLAPFGSMLHDTQNGTIYQNVSNVSTSPNWEAMTSIPVQPFSWTAGQNPNGTLLFTAPQKCGITMFVKLDVAEGAAAVIQPVQATGSTPITSGTPVFSSFDANQTAPVGMNLAFTSDVDLDVGDRLGITTTGRWTRSCGSILAFAWQI